MWLFHVERKFERFFILTMMSLCSLKVIERSARLFIIYLRCCLLDYLFGSTQKVSSICSLIIHLQCKGVHPTYACSIVGSSRVTHLCWLDNTRECGSTQFYIKVKEFCVAVVVLFFSVVDRVRFET